VELTGTPWTFPQLAGAIGRAAGRAVSVKTVASAEAGPLGWLFSLIAAGLYERSTPDLERLLGRRATSVDDFVANLVARKT
jgi:NAD(P)H dehydrogenase (quinone)